MSRVVVTGGAGFIGSHVVDLLVTDPTVDVHVIDNLSSGSREHVHPRAVLHELDVRDHAALRNLTGRIGSVAAWFHLAAQVDVRKSVADPYLDADINIAGTLSVLDAALADSATVVFASTGGAIYGGEEVPATEETPARPAAPYGASKLAAEGYIAQYARLHRQRHSILRLANVYGPRQDPHGEAGVVAIFGGKLRAGERATIYGTGEQTRDYVYVTDVAAAFREAWRAADDGRDAALRVDGDVPVFNIGTGRETSVLALWESAVEAAGSDPGYATAPARLGELERSALDATRARNILGIPICTTIDEGMGLTIDSIAPVG